MVVYTVVEVVCSVWVVGVVVVVFVVFVFVVVVVAGLEVYYCVAIVIFFTFLGEVVLLLLPS